MCNTGVDKSQVAKLLMMVSCRFLENLCTPEVLPVQLSGKTTILSVAVLQCIMR